MKFRKKPIVVDAIQFNGENYEEIEKFTDNAAFKNTTLEILYINTLEGTMRINDNDWVIKGVNGEFYPCKPDIFEKTYDKVENE